MLCVSGDVAQPAGLFTKQGCHLGWGKGWRLTEDDTDRLTGSIDLTDVERPGQDLEGHCGKQSLCLMGRLTEAID